LAGLCGLLYAARLQAGDPKIGATPPLELGAITAAVVGGASLSGGKGSVAGTVFGALFMGILDNGLGLQGMQDFDQRIVKESKLAHAGKTFPASTCCGTKPNGLTAPGH